MANANSRRNIVFVHPDLGIGGAERLVIDAAVSLKSLGHKVTILTSHCDPSHCFEEARDGTLDVRVRGNSICPPSLGGRLIIFCSTLRQLHLVLSVGVFSSELRQLNPDIFFVDQLSACVPFFRLLCARAKVLFYGHYPDRLLVKEDHGLRQRLKRVYRVPFDALEGWSTSCADSVVVNSKFTRSVFRQTFPHMRARELKVIYPCVDTDMRSTDELKTPALLGKTILLSINRFELKKDIDLAIRAYAGLSEEERSKASLILAGGYDPRNRENAVCHQHLQTLADSLNLSHTSVRNPDKMLTDMTSEEADVIFLLSIPHELKQRLLNSASLLLYTPKNEHFGIVPLEAMLAGVPVLATNTGGPLETIYDGRTGWLRSPDKVAQWTDVMRKPLIPSSVDNLRLMGRRGRERVLAEFSNTKMTDSLDKEIQHLVQSRGPRPAVVPRLFLPVTLAILFAIVGGIIGWQVIRNRYLMVAPNRNGFRID